MKKAAGITIFLAFFSAFQLFLKVPYLAIIINAICVMTILGAAIAFDKFLDTF